MGVSEAACKGLCATVALLWNFQKERNELESSTSIYCKMYWASGIKDQKDHLIETMLAGQLLWKYLYPRVQLLTPVSNKTSEMMGHWMDM